MGPVKAVAPASPKRAKASAAPAKPKKAQANRLPVAVVAAVVAEPIVDAAPAGAARPGRPSRGRKPAAASAPTAQLELAPRTPVEHADVAHASLEHAAVAECPAPDEVIATGEALAEVAAPAAEPVVDRTADVRVSIAVAVADAAPSDASSAVAEGPRENAATVEALLPVAAERLRHEAAKPREPAPAARLRPAPLRSAPRAALERNIFSDEIPADDEWLAGRASPAEEEARSFWDSPDDLSPASTTPPPRRAPPSPVQPTQPHAHGQHRHAPIAAVQPARAPAQQAAADDDEFEGDGRKRKRKRRRRGRVQTDLPIDTPQMKDIVERLRRQFGLRAFRPGQERVIRNVFARRDTLAVMPTGSGKSLTFQLPAMVLEGVTLVVSPLLALMKDQTDKMKKRGVNAARLDSTLTASGTRETLAQIEEGSHKLVYVTPERVGSADFKEELGNQPVSLFVIDEAHCVSQWGHDFRPAYLNLKRVLEELGRPPVLALTATATERVVTDIKDRLGMIDPDTVHLGFSRPELIFEVRAVGDETAQVKRLLRLVRRIKGSGIVYCSTIDNVDALAGVLPRLGLRVGKYHGKMTKYERDSEQQKFMKNEVRVMIATNAFGLGVDKPDIRFVIHYNLPGSIEQYYQEAGRAGRDGKPARCILLWREGDEKVQEHFVQQKYPGRDQVRAVTQALLAGPGKVSDIAMRAGVQQKKAQVVMAMLEEANLAKPLGGDVFTATTDAADEQVIWNAAEAYRKKRESDRERLQAMLNYAEGRRCRVQILLSYFEQEVPPCGRCDVCTGKLGASDDEDDEEEAQPLRPALELPSVPPPPRKDPTTMF